MIIAWSEGDLKSKGIILDLVGITRFGDMRNRMAGRALDGWTDGDTGCSKRFGVILILSHKCSRASNLEPLIYLI